LNNCLGGDSCRGLDLHCQHALFTGQWRHGAGQRESGAMRRDGGRSTGEGAATQKDSRRGRIMGLYAQMRGSYSPCTFAAGPRQPGGYSSAAAMRYRSLIARGVAPPSVTEPSLRFSENLVRSPAAAEIAHLPIPDLRNNCQFLATSLRRYSTGNIPFLLPA